MVRCCVQKPYIVYKENTNEIYATTSKRFIQRNHSKRERKGGGGVNPQIMSFLFEFLFFLNDFCLGSKWYAAIDTWIFGYHYKWKIIKKHKFQIRLVWVMRNLDGLIGSCDLKNEKKNGWKFHHGISLAVSA